MTAATTSAAVISAISMAACGSAATSSAAPLNRVEIVRQQPSIPPQYRHDYDKVLTSAAQVQAATAAFENRNVVIGGTTSQSGTCAGGDTWTVTLTRTDGSTAELDATLCGGGASANATGDVAGLISDLQAIP